MAWGPWGCEVSSLQTLALPACGLTGGPRAAGPGGSCAHSGRAWSGDEAAASLARWLGVGGCSWNLGTLADAARGGQCP